MPDSLLITCEHASNLVPARYRRQFRGLAGMLKTHRGHDLGAVVVADELAAAFKAPLVAATVTRLVVDLNRSVGHPRLHVNAVRALPAAERERIIDEYYRPYRDRVDDLAGRAIALGWRVVHIAVHSFTPELDGKVRSADIGLLYDPGRPGEVRLCERWKAQFARVAPDLRVRRNYPYAGTDDGFIPYLRGRHARSKYIGVEIEINQAFVTGTPLRFAQLRHAVIESLRAALATA